MLVRITSRAAGTVEGHATKPGDEIEISDRAAALLIADRAAVAVDAPDVDAPDVGAVVVEAAVVKPAESAARRPARKRTG